LRKRKKNKKKKRKKKRKKRQGKRKLKRKRKKKRSKFHMSGAAKHYPSVYPLSFFWMLFLTPL